MMLTGKVLGTFLALTILAAVGYSGSGQARATVEYYVKAAFVCQLTRFVEWPKEKAPEPNMPIVIGVIGEDRFADAFDIARQGRHRIVVRQFKAQKRSDQQDPNQQEWTTYLAQLMSCHILYFVGQQEDLAKQIIEQVCTAGVLTIGESEGFLEVGGIINLLVPDPKIRFEVSLVAARRARIRIPAQVLRLAARVIDQKDKK